MKWLRSTSRGVTRLRLALLIGAAATILNALGATSPSTASAATVASIKYTWDYTATPPSDLTGFVVKVGTTSGTYTQTSPAITPGTVRTVTMGFPSGEGKFYAAVFAVDAAGNLSAASNEVVFTVDTTAPPAPTNFSVTITYSVTVP